MSKARAKTDLQHFAKQVLGFELSEAQLQLAQTILDADKKGERVHIIGGWRRSGYTSTMQVVNEMLIKREVERKQAELLRDMVGE